MNENRDTWIYYNGELYHAGVRGMQWGKHLPGTDWWKETNQKYYNQNPNIQQVQGGQQYAAKPTTWQKIKANVNTAGQAAKIYGRKVNLAGRILTKQAGAAISKGAYKVAKGASNAYYAVKKGVSKFWSDPKKYTSEQAAKLSEFAKSAYSEARKNVVNFFTIDSAERSTAYHNERYGPSTPLSHLDTFQNKQLNDAVESYYKTKINSSFGQKLDYWFQNAQYGIVKGVNNYLKQIGMDDEVDNFISKFRGDSSYRTSRNNKKHRPGGKGSNVTYTLN